MWLESLILSHPRHIRRILDPSSSSKTYPCTTVGIQVHVERCPWFAWKISLYQSPPSLRMGLSLAIMNLTFWRSSLNFAYKASSVPDLVKHRRRTDCPWRGHMENSMNQSNNPSLSEHVRPFTFPWWFLLNRNHNIGSVLYWSGSMSTKYKVLNEFFVMLEDYIVIWIWIIKEVHGVDSFLKSMKIPAYSSPL